MTRTVAPLDIRQHEERLTGLIRVVESHDDFALLREHLRSARVYVSGAMPSEYAAALTDARRAAGEAANPNLRKSLEAAIDLLIDDTQREATTPDESAPSIEKPQGEVPDKAQSKLWNFFSTDDISFGVFYPKRHAIATFASFEVAESAGSGLRNAGFGMNEVMAVRASEMMQFVAELKQHTGLWGQVMGEVSRFFATEEIFVKEDVDSASKGAGFLAVYCPSDQEFERARAAIMPFEPVSMQRYLASGIQSI